MEQFGLDNAKRMTGGYETSDYDKFSSGVASRATSFRIPSATAKTWKGYAEDRRPSSNCDPYRVTKCVFEYVI
jgi:glutamine synthetase